MKHTVDKRDTIRLIELRGPSGRLYGRLDPERMVIEVKRKGEKPEVIELGPYLKTS